MACDYQSTANLNHRVLVSLTDTDSPVQVSLIFPVTMFADILKANATVINIHCYVTRGNTSLPFRRS